ncbi:MAG: hypothetical protein AUG49_08480 [Catenulispora sp. 13_1_20CM_3_70_7]|jgi:hypothetical protein|nr:MAG: hypothetical protein AUG49_08480 [Catenulispora sp. 13_1_20CM_3_70_7]
MNRRALGTLILAGLVIVGTSGASGGCSGGSDGRGVSAPAVGAGGEESAPKEESKPPASSDEHSEDHEGDGKDHPTDEPTEKGHPSCTFAPASLSLKGNKVTGTGQMICHEEPKMLSGSLVLVFTHYRGGNWEYVEDSRISLTNLDIGKHLTVSTVCNEGYWLILWTATGKDAKGRDFTAPPYNYPAPPHKIDSCP